MLDYWVSKSLLAYFQVREVRVSVFKIILPIFGLFVWPWRAKMEAGRCWVLQNQVGEANLVFSLFFLLFDEWSLNLWISYFACVFRLFNWNCSGCWFFMVAEWFLAWCGFVFFSVLCLYLWCLNDMRWWFRNIRLTYINIDIDVRGINLGVLDRSGSHV